LACILLLILNTDAICTPAPWLLAADEEMALRGGIEEIKKEIKIAGIIITILIIASFSIIIITGFILEAFVGLSLRGIAAIWINLGFLLLAKLKIPAGVV
jgi:hypothetical protein